MMMIKFSTVVRMKFYVSHVKVSKVAYQEGFKILQITRVIWKHRHLYAIYAGTTGTSKSVPK